MVSNYNSWFLHSSLINPAELIGNSLHSTPAAVSGLSPASFLHRDNMGKSGVTGGGTMPKMSMSLLRENNNRLVYSLDMSNKIERFNFN